MLSRLFLIILLGFPHVHPVSVELWVTPLGAAETDRDFWTDRLLPSTVIVMNVRVGLALDEAPSLISELKFNLEHAQQPGLDVRDQQIPLQPSTILNVGAGGRLRLSVAITFDSRLIQSEQVH